MFSGSTDAVAWSACGTNDPITSALHIALGKRPAGDHFTNNFSIQQIFKCDGNFILLSSKY